MSKARVLVTGAGGFIGHHLVKRLKQDGFWARGVDIKSPEFEPSDADDFLLLDLRRWSSCLLATDEIDHVYNLAADMGGIGYNRLRQVLEWEPSISLRKGIAKTYAWILGEVAKADSSSKKVAHA